MPPLLNRTTEQATVSPGLSTTPLSLTRVFARDRDFRKRQVAELIFRRPQFRLRIEERIPFNRSAAIRRFAAHDGRQCALGDGLGFVERRPSADAGDEVLVFLLIRVYVLLAESPELSVRGLDIICAVARAFRAHHCLADFALAAIHLPALAEHSGEAKSAR